MDLLYNLAMIAGPDRPVVTIGNPWSFLPTGHKDTGVHHVFVADWMAAVQILIQKAELIVVYGGRSGGSMEFELSEILRMGLKEKTVMFSRPKEDSPYDRFPEVDHSSLMKMFGQNEDFFETSGAYGLKAFDNRERFARPSIEVWHLVAEWIRTAFPNWPSLRRP